MSRIDFFNFAVAIFVFYYLIVILILFDNIKEEFKENRQIKTKKDLFYLFFPFSLMPKLLYQLAIHIKSWFINIIKKIVTFFKELE